MCLVGICFAECNENLTIALLTIGVNFQGALYTGFFVNPLDIASNYAGKLFNKTIELIMFMFIFCYNKLFRSNPTSHVFKEPS